MAEKGPICKDEKLGESLKQCFEEFTRALEEQLKEQKKQGLPVDEALKNVRKARRYVKKLVG